VRLAVVADPDPAARRALAEALDRSGLAVVECGEGARLWSLLAENRSTYAVFACASLPGLGGAELARRLAATRELRRIPVVVTSAKTDPATVGRLLAVGVTAVMGKAADPTELEAALAATGRAAERLALASNGSSSSAMPARRPRPIAIPTSTPPEVTP